MTQPELAKVMGIAVNTIGNIERGEHPGYIDKIIMLCYYLGQHRTKTVEKFT